SPASDKIGYIYCVAISSTKQIAELAKLIEKYEYTINYTQEIRKSPCNTHIVNEQMVTSVTKTKDLPYQGQVYNIAVEEDESYCLNFCVHNCSLRDNWMDAEWTLQSPYRKHFKYIICPTIDGEPQKAAWINDY